VRSIVIDASIALGLLLAEPGFETIRTQIADWRRNGVPLYVPAHFWLEVMNGLAISRRLPAEIVLEAIHRLDELDLRTEPLLRPHVLLALDAVERFGLTAYDATYLSLAEILDADVYTLDHSLRTVATESGRAVVAGTDHRLADSRAPYGSSPRPSWPAYRELSSYLARLRAEARAG